MQKETTDSFNSIKSDIHSADIPDDHKELIHQLLSDLPKTNDKKATVSKFLSDISNGSISGVTCDSITRLLSVLVDTIC